MSAVLYVAVDNDCPSNEGTIHYKNGHLRARMKDNYSLQQWQHIIGDYLYEKTYTETRQD